MVSCNPNAYCSTPFPPLFSIMSIRQLSTGVFALSTLIQHSVAAPSGPVVSFKFPEVVEAGGMHNVHVDYHSSHDGAVSYTHLTLPTKRIV